MSKSNPKRKLTRAGVALTAEARRKLQQVADWLEAEAVTQQDPRIRFANFYPVVNQDGITMLSPVGVLIQMFEPFKLVEAKRVAYGMHAIMWDPAFNRASAILGITREEYRTLGTYWYKYGHRPEQIAKAIRELK